MAGGYNYSCTKAREGSSGSISIQTNFLIEPRLQDLCKNSAECLNKVLENYIHPGQTGFVKTRLLGDIRWVLNLIYHVHGTKSPTVFYFVDASNAFDRVEWTFMKFVIKEMWVGCQFTSCLEMTYNEQSARVKLEGHLSGSFSSHRRVRQCCPLPPLLFSLVIEILVIAARWSNKLFQGIQMASEMHKVGSTMQKLFLLLAREKKFIIIEKSFISTIVLHVWWVNIEYGFWGNTYAFMFPVIF